MTHGLVNSTEVKNILIDIERLLKQSNNLPQMKIISQLIKSLDTEEGNFINLINQADMWGGSGAVWEVYIADRETYKLFQLKIIALINLLDINKITTPRQNRIKILFENEINKG